MRQILPLAVAVTLCGITTEAASVGDDLTATATRDAITLCDALTSLRPFEMRSLTVRGIVGAGQESIVIYDPDCQQNVQPVAALEVTELTVGWDKVRPALSKTDAEVVVEGMLSGPRCVPYRTLLSPEEYKEEMSPCGRYGDGSFRAELFVKRVLSVAQVPRETRQRMMFWHPTGLRFPIVVGGDMPHYPAPARVLEISGSVEAEVTVDDGAVKSVKLISGDPMLAAETIRCLKTWRFSKLFNTTFRTTFMFEFEQRDKDANQNTRLEMELPTKVHVLGTIDKW